MPAKANTNAQAAMNRIEFTGVRYLGCSFVNQVGMSRSHPATIGMRVVAVKITLEFATVREVAAKTANGTKMATAPAEPRPKRKACGIGPTRSSRSRGTNAWTADVPRMNIRAMTGAAIMTDRAIVRRASRASPASTATYSNPDNAPTASFPKIFTLSSVNAGAVIANGWYARSVPRAMLMTGRMSSKAKALMSKMAPTLWTHLLTPRPRIEITTSAPMSTPAMAPMYTWFPASAWALGPIAYTRALA